MHSTNNNGKYARVTACFQSANGSFKCEPLAQDSVPAGVHDSVPHMKLMPDMNGDGLADWFEVSEDRILLKLNEGGPHEQYTFGKGDSSYDAVAGEVKCEKLSVVKLGMRDGVLCNRH